MTRRKTPAYVRLHDDLPGPSLSTVVAADVPTSLRLQVTFTAFVVLLAIAMAAVTVLIVTRIFDRLTPALRADLVWATEHTAHELADEVDVGLAVDDTSLVDKGFAKYTSGTEVTALIAVDAAGNLVASYGPVTETPAALFAGPPEKARDAHGAFIAWAPVAIEGKEIGKVAVVVSTARLAAGEHLRRQLLFAAFLSSLVALAMGVAFVRYKVGPVIKLTLRALADLRALAGSLEERVARRTAELTESKDDLEKALDRLTATQRELIATSRTAGMADVATSVLHNVGNVLNSVNVSSTLVTDTMKRSRIAGVGKVAKLLHDHRGDLAAFLTSDPRGKKLPEYLHTLAVSLDQERGTMLEELDSLSTNMNHIRVIINMQQTNAKACGGVEELLKIEDLVEDALRFNMVSFEKHGVDIVRDYEPLPAVILDRHKLFQILMNLVSNARHAVKHLAGRHEIAVRVARGGADRVVIQVRDNGVGIPAANMQKIFVHGFTTKTEGHGFGLHSSALAATELGGSLVASSAGPGQGAMFTIDLPLVNAATGAGAAEAAATTAAA